MAEDGIVGTYNGSQAREVLVTLEQWQAANGEPEPPEPPKPLRRNRILPDPSDDEDEPRALLPARVSGARISVDDEDSDEGEDDESFVNGPADDLDDEDADESDADDDESDGDGAEDQQPNDQPRVRRFNAESA